MKIWHDDVRKPPDDSWKWARTNSEAQALLSQGASEISLDYDLGLWTANPDNPRQIRKMYIQGYAKRGQNGLALARWMSRHSHLVPDRVVIHSTNDRGALAMARVLRRHSPKLRKFGS